RFDGSARGVAAILARPALVGRNACGREAGHENRDDEETVAHGVAQKRCSGDQVGHALEAMTPLARPAANALHTAAGNLTVAPVARHPSMGCMGSGAMHDVAVQTPSLAAGFTTAKLVASPAAAVQVERSTSTVEPGALQVRTSKQPGGVCESHSGSGSILRS